MESTRTTPITSSDSGRSTSSPRTTRTIGIQYAFTGLLFLLFGFTLMMIMRWQMAYPGKPIPLIRQLARAPIARRWASCCPSFTTSSGAMHGTIMVFLGVVPLAVGGFGNFVMPLQIGAPDMAFPKLNMMSYWVYFLGGVTMLTSFFLKGGAAQSGWTSYPPLSVITATNGQTMWLIGMIFLITSSLLGSVNFIVTIVQLRAKGLTYMRLPFFVWAQFVTSFLLLLAFPPLEAAGVLQLMDKARGHELLPSKRAGRERQGRAGFRPGQSAPVAAPVLVPRSPRKCTC
jgi:cytochrome c oxidase subunit 1